MSLFTTCLVVAAVALLTAWPVALWREKRTFSRPAAAFLRLHPAGRGFYQFGLDMDTDGDGLADAFESLVTLTDTLASDSDLDGLPDGKATGIYRLMNGAGKGVKHASQKTWQRRFADTARNTHPE